MSGFSNRNIDKLIGEGSFGEVYSTDDDQQKFAIKLVQKYPSKYCSLSYDELLKKRLQVSLKQKYHKDLFP